MHKIGIIGCGFVGSAVAAGFTLKADIKIYDKYKEGFDSLSDVCKQDILFLCLPTPMRKSDNLPEMSYILETLAAMHHETSQVKSLISKIIVIKSTVLPGTNRLLQAMYPGFSFVSNPEFLTARSARLDFINASRIVLGGIDEKALNKVGELYRQISLHAPIYQCSWETAELVKYMANCFFALKISYLNEIYKISQRIGCNYNFLKQIWLADGRIGNSHHEVPGHDGDFGFGGTCFPKDIAAFTEYAKILNMPIETLNAARKVNEEVRSKKDWQTFDDLEDKS
jgi:UDPglucose 6-dehydrogenase